MSKKSIRERLVVPQSLQENLLLGEINEDDRLDLSERLLLGESKLTVLVELDGSGAGGEEESDHIEVFARRRDVKGGLSERRREGDEIQLNTLIGRKGKLEGHDLREG